MPAFFGIRFLICNGLISVLICIILLAKQLLKSHISQRMQYNIWFLLLAILAIPFLPIRPVGFDGLFSWLNGFGNSTEQIQQVGNHLPAAITQNPSIDWMNNFSISVSSKTPSIIGTLLFVFWLMGIAVMLILVMCSNMRLKAIEHSALPLQNRNVRKIFNECTDQLNMKAHIPIFSTAFLKSPVSEGLMHPRIYIPIHMISDFNEKDIRYIILHELQHCKHKDIWANYLMNLAVILYWFNPLVWYALKEMKDDREVACDTSVLHILNKTDYKDYGNTLINFAQKVSHFPFPYATMMGGSVKQIRRRIANIASFRTVSTWTRIKGISAFILIGALLLGCAPVLSIYAFDNTNYNFTERNTSYRDLSSYFDGCGGSFVLYNANSNLWEIYNKEVSIRRVSPDFTYKIYSALFGLESKIITPSSSSTAWNGDNYPFEAWNQNQDLNLAMQNSVNWYFQSLDEQAGMDNLKHYIRKINYGNQDLSGGLPEYWLESSLKISPVEQVMELKSLYNNDYNFKADNIDTVKKSLFLFSDSDSSIYGKTGTGRVNGQDVNGWFIGFIEEKGNVYFFATNIQNKANATGTAAAQITFSILSGMGIYK